MTVVIFGLLIRSFFLFTYCNLPASLFLEAFICRAPSWHC